MGLLNVPTLTDVHTPKAPALTDPRTPISHYTGPDYVLATELAATNPLAFFSLAETTIRSPAAATADSLLLHVNGMLLLENTLNGEDLQGLLSSWDHCKAYISAFASWTKAYISRLPAAAAAAVQGPDHAAGVEDANQLLRWLGCLLVWMPLQVGYIHRDFNGGWKVGDRKWNPAGFVKEAEGGQKPTPSAMQLLLLLWLARAVAATAPQLLPWVKPVHRASLTGKCSSSNSGNSSGGELRSTGSSRAEDSSGGIVESSRRGNSSSSSGEGRTGGGYDLRLRMWFWEAACRLLKLPDCPIQTKVVVLALLLHHCIATWHNTVSSHNVSDSRSSSSNSSAGGAASAAAAGGAGGGSSKAAAAGSSHHTAAAAADVDNDDDEDQLPKRLSKLPQCGLPPRSGSSANSHQQQLVRGGAGEA